MKERFQKITRKISSEVKPGEQIIHSISAMPGGLGEQVLREIAHPKTQPMRHRREFTGWTNNMCFGKIWVDDGNYREVVLKLGVKEGLFLDSELHKLPSLKHVCDGDKCILSLVPMYGKKSSGIETWANMIVGVWIIHGRNWTDRAGDSHYWPYGVDLHRRATFNFKVVDGKGKSFREAVVNNAMRSGHVGTWNPATVVPAAMGLPVLLHEFQERSDGIPHGFKITCFGDIPISSNGNGGMWGPYLEWGDVRSVDFGPFSDIVQKASSPFAFHVAATKAAFSNCQLASSFLLDKAGKEKLIEVLEIITEKEPERFYRLIDEQGITHHLTGHENGNLVYGKKPKITFPVKSAIENVVETLKELSELERRPDFGIVRKKRLVPDTHFYVVVMGCLSQQDGVCHHLAGTEMHKYLIGGKDAYMHSVRNERLFNLIKHVFELEKLEFCIYPSSLLRLPRVNQYNFDSSKWNPDHWLGKTLA